MFFILGRRLIFLTIFKHLRGDGDAVMAFMAEMANFAK